MLEFFILLVVLLVMALTGFTLVAMLLVSGLFVLLGALGGMLALIIKLAPWLLLVLAVCWLISNRGKRSNTYLLPG
ncbi:envelope stress response protein PspG [Aeromonas hydrophila]|uniref:envelope stress response protein PspG n=1 Tax=Aeromonas hydrophila TaxID=644 RepID=UPI003F667750